MSKALFIGRFQPFHIAHLEDIKMILRQFDSVIIGIGSSQYSNTKDNPFTYKQRKRMIDETLKDESISDYEIKEIPDIHDDERWVEHVISITGKVDKIFTGNDWTEGLFKKAGYDVFKIELIPDISSTIIRENILEGQEWEHLLPEKVVEIIKEIDGENIIKNC